MLRDALLVALPLAKRTGREQIAVNYTFNETLQPSDKNRASTPRSWKIQTLCVRAGEDMEGGNGREKR